jgi:hypothetical protein
VTTEESLDQAIIVAWRVKYGNSGWKFFQELKPVHEVNLYNINKIFLADLQPTLKGEAFMCKEF